ncbi:MAG: hypothetical protein WBW61_07705 [Rhodanobacteraceae bacterium]
MERTRGPIPKFPISHGNLAAPSVASPAVQSAPRDEKKTRIRQAPAAQRAGNAEREADRMSAAKAEIDHAPPVAPVSSMNPAPPAPASSPAQSSEQNAAPGMSGSSPRTANPELTVQALIDAARAALRQGDTDAARKLVRTLRRDYPKRTLPADLAPLAPANGRSE